MSMEWPVRAEWLSQVSEAPLEPDLPIIDAHHHLWKLPHDAYLLPDLLADAGPDGAGHNIVATVYADEGPTAKRIRPRAQGRAYRIRKRTSHITVIVESRPPRDQRAGTGQSTRSRRAEGSKAAKTAQPKKGGSQ
jgi:hypothetical protein